MSDRPTPDEIADIYRDARARVVTLIGSLSDDQLALQVPGTPKWSVRDLIGHFVGCPVAMMAGQFEGAGSDEWTQAQVDARRDNSVAELMAEWQAGSDAIDAAIRAGDVPVQVALDIVAHELDLRGAIGASGHPDPLALRFLVNGFGARVKSVVGKTELAPVELRDPDSGWSAGTSGGVVAEASEFEWARALTGRRSNDQVRGYEWTGDPAPYLELLCPFGLLPDTDISD
jgi:uncharacterized protein (TIGR03083 family)